MSQPATDWDPMAEGSQRNPAATDKEMRGRCPVAYSEQFGGFWALFRHEDISAAARDTSAFISTPTYSWPKLDTGTPWVPLQADPPMHRQYRKIITPFFRGERLRSFEPRLTELTNQLIDTFIDNDRVDAARELNFPLPASAICLLLGLPESNWSNFVKWTTDIIECGARGDFAGLEAVYADVSAFADDWIKERRSNPGDDLMDAMLQATVDGRPMTDVEIHGMFTLLFAAGHETTANALSASMHYLAENPTDRARLINEPELLEAATEEFIRWSAPVRCLARTTAKDVKVGERTIPAGEPVVLMFGSGSRDESVFPDPDECTFDRKDARKHLSFGDGIHRCIGEDLARMEVRVVLRELLRRIPNFEMDGEIKKSTWPTNGYHALPLRIYPAPH